MRALPGVLPWRLRTILGWLTAGTLAASSPVRWMRPAARSAGSWPPLGATRHRCRGARASALGQPRPWRRTSPAPLQRRVPTGEPACASRGRCRRKCHTTAPPSPPTLPAPRTRHGLGVGGYLRFVLKRGQVQPEEQRQTDLAALPGILRLRASVALPRSRRSPTPAPGRPPTADSRNYSPRSGQSVRGLGRQQSGVELVYRSTRDRPSAVLRQARDIAGARRLPATAIRRSIRRPGRLEPAISRPSRRTRKLALGMPAMVSFPATNLRAASARLGHERASTNGGFETLRHGFARIIRNAGIRRWGSLVSTTPARSTKLRTGAIACSHGWPPL